MGLVGAFVGGFLDNGMGIEPWWQVLILQVVVAAILVLLVNSLIRSQTRNRSRTR